MLKAKTLFVLGAGASVELGMPLGYQLQSRIRDILTYEIKQIAAPSSERPLNTPIFRALRNLGHAEEDAYQAMRRVENGIEVAPSVDTFLHNNGHDAVLVTCGKLAIIHAILLCERDSPLSGDDQATRHCAMRKINNPDGVPAKTLALRNSYISAIWDEICQPHSRANLADIFANVEFINFNYDRSLEEGFKQKLKRGFGIDGAEAHQIVDGLKILRPYGAPHGSAAYSAARPGYGAVKDIPLDKICGNIRTFTETVDGARSDLIKAAVSAAELVVFLGFGFHSQNVDLLSAPTDTFKHVWFSWYEGSEANSRSIKGLIESGICKSRVGITTANVWSHTGTSLNTLRDFQFQIFRRY